MTTVFTICTADHRALSNQLKEDSLNKANINLEIIECPLPSGGFMTSEFYDVQCFKIMTLLERLKNNLFAHTIYLDSDIVILGDFVSAMINNVNDCDVCFQRDRDSYCAGMFICKNNQRTISFFEGILDRCHNLKDQYLLTAADQTIINDTLRNDDCDLSVSFLDERFTTYGNINTEKQFWDGDDFDLPYDTLAFHANFTIGIKNKEALLSLVRSKRISAIRKN
jgi:hypothetical protein